MAERLAKISGTLQELSGEELARQQGLSAAPPTPLAAQGIGASQDVAKMAGTPNQIRAMVQDTLMERTRTKDLLGESERTNGRARYSVESLQEKMNVLEGLGSLENRVPEYIRTQLKTAAQGPVSAANVPNAGAVAERLASLGITDKASVDNAVNAVAKLRDGTATPEDISAALSALKINASITDSTSTLATTLAPFFTQTTVDDLKKQMSTVLQNFSDIKMKDLPEEFKRFADPQNDVDDAAAILGIDDAKFGEMTLSDVRAQLKAWKSRNFQDVEILRDVLQDPSYSMTEKDFARQRLAELGALGVTSIEQKTNNLEAQVAEGDTVVVGGQAVKVSELMSDPKLKATIATALDSEEELTKLASTDADLAKWITNNKAALVPVRNELLKGTEKFVANNKVFADKFGEDGATYSKLFDSLIPGWKNAKSQDWATWSAEATKTNPTLISVLNEPPSAERSQKLDILAALPTEYAKTFNISNVNAIANAAKGDPAKATQLAKDWYDSSQPDVTSLTADAALQGFTPELDTDFGQQDYDNFTSTIIESFTGTKQGMAEYVQRMKELAAGTPEQRSQAITMYRQLGDIAKTIKTKLSPTNVTNLKGYAKTKKDKEGVVTQKQAALELANKKSSITPKPLMEVYQLFGDGVRARLNRLGDLFTKDFAGIGDELRGLLAGKKPQSYLLWAAKNQRNATPTVDNLILFINDRVRGLGSSHGGYSKASIAAGDLFKIRDELESQGRTEAAQITSDLRTAQAEANQAKSNYEIFTKGLLAK